MAILEKVFTPSETEEVEMTIYPSAVSYFEKEWSIYGTNDKDQSRNFIISSNKKSLFSR
ncbi:hypothetical protein ABQ520_18455 [Bacillus velezensis]|uniref:hypothetical protein n=1 Tax=Bacillus velezensis TaxID=492670 RepID=UPI0034A3456D